MTRIAHEGNHFGCESDCLVQLSKQRKCPKVLTESANSHLGLPTESPKRVSRTVQTLFRTGGKCPKRGFRTVQETVLGVSPRRPENTFRTLVKAVLGILAVLTVVPGNQTRNTLGQSNPGSPGV